MSLRGSFAAFFSLGLAFAAFGCTVGRESPDGGNGGGTDSGSPTVDAFHGAGSIVIMPADYDATIMGAPVEIDYTAFRVEPDGSMTDVTAMATWSVLSLGTFSGAHFTSGIDRGGRTSVRATVLGVVGTTSLTLHLTRDVIASDAPADAPTHFTGTPDPTNAPMFVYPDDGVMIPPNLERFELHFMPNGSTLFRMDVSTGPVDLHVYFGCTEPVGGGCIFTPDHEAWGVISDAARGQGPIAYTLTGTDSAGRVGTSEPRTIQFANEDITGGVYYWNAAAGSIMRYEFGVPGAVEETFLRGMGAVGCIGCHAVSRDGTRIAVGLGPIPTSQVRVYDVTSRNMLFQNFQGTNAMGAPAMLHPSYFSFSPDSTQIVSNNPRGLNIIDATGNVVLAGITTGNSTMPDWSADGDHIVYVEAPSSPGGIDAPVSGGSLVRTDWNGTQWVTGSRLAEANGGNNYHPTYAPDSDWIVYNRSPSNVNSMGDSSGDGDCVGDAELWVVAGDGGSAARPLAIGGACSSWPKFDPTTYHDHGHDLFWVAWATSRGYGLRYGDHAIMQIWMAAFDPTLAASGAEPTHPAFRLPFQNITTGNHIAQWVTSIERMGCTTNADCGGEFCVDGRCYDQVPVF
jgi:hypothetical protein